MARTLLQRWLDHYDSIHRGWTLEGIANGVCATSGFFFPRIRGGYNLRRGENEVPELSSPIVGAAGADASAIHIFPWISHNAGTTYVYRLSAISGGGVGNAIDETTAEAGFDAAGDWCGLVPNSPSDLRVTPTADGKFLVEWAYSAEGQQISPWEFHLYHDAGTGSVDFETVVANVSYRAGRYHYAYTSASFDHGTRIKWAVRAATSGTEDENIRVVFGWADAESPPINPAVIISKVDD